MFEAQIIQVTAPIAVTVTYRDMLTLACALGLSPAGQLELIRNVLIKKNKNTPMFNIQTKRTCELLNSYEVVGRPELCWIEH